MSVLKHPIVIIIAVLGLIVYLINHFTSHSIAFIQNHFNDLLCMPLVLSLTLGLTRIIKKNEAIYIALSSIIVLTVYFSFHFEWMMPRLSDRYTADILDVALYVFGAILFYTFQKKLF